MLTAFDGETITYDASGNPLSYYNGTRWNFTWENGRNLATASSAGGSLSFEYDSDGLRTKKTVSGEGTHYYFYAGGQLLRESYSGNFLDFSYDANGYPYALKYNGTTYYYITNLQGDVMYLVDGTGATVASYVYDPYGNIISATGTMAEINPLRYRGYYYDAELGMYYLQSRYYDPMVGRFINADSYASTGQGLLGTNMFAYCNNNVPMRTDSGGDTSYSNSVTYKNGLYSVKTVIKILWRKLTYNYTIKSNGIVQFSFSKNDYFSALWRGVEKTLAQAIYHAAKSINRNFLWGRTIGGIDTEMKLHYIAYTLGIKRSSSQVADMGGTFKKKIGYDSNAWFFEGGNAIGILVDYNIYRPGNIRKAILAIARYL